MIVKIEKSVMLEKVVSRHFVSLSSVKRQTFRSEKLFSGRDGCPILEKPKPLSPKRCRFSLKFRTHFANSTPHLHCLNPTSQPHAHNLQLFRGNFKTPNIKDTRSSTLVTSNTFFRLIYFFYIFIYLYHSNKNKQN